MSPQPIGLLGQPSTCAIGLGMAIVSGVRAIDGGLPSPTRAGWSLVVASYRSSVAQPVDAGLHTSGRGPSTASFQPRASAVVAPPLALVRTTTRAHLPSALPSSLA